MRDLRFGIEIEVVGQTRESIAAAIREVTGGTQIASRVRAADGRIWKVVPDGSLRASFGYQAEIVSPILTYSDIETLQEIVRAVRRVGARVNSSCGIHIHVESRTFSTRAVSNLIKMVHKQEFLIEEALGVSWERRQSFCRRIDQDFLARLEQSRPRTTAEMHRVWYGRRTDTSNRYHHSRYASINLHSMFYRGTIEFRMFESTLHAGKVKAYIQFVLALSTKAIQSRSASSKRRPLDVATAKYDFRVFLLRLGLVGKEFKTARLHLLSRLHGSAAWKGERRDRPRRAS